MSQLPLPLPFCSIRIQYSGAPGAVVAEVSSVDASRGLAVDAPVQNEGNGWAGSGANPWHLDSQTESILFLTNESDKPARIGFSITANGVHYYLTMLKLAPHETRAIDIRQLRDAQVADFKQNRIPAAATDGSVSWVRIDNVPVMGRLMVIERHNGLAASYDCCACPCPNSYISIGVTPSNFNVAVGWAYSCTATAEYDDCNSNQYYYDETSNSTWSSSDASIASVNSSGGVTGLTSGSATISATYSDCTYDQSCTCFVAPSTGSCTATVTPTITGPNTVWWFNGQNPSGYATSITLTASSSTGGSYSWSNSSSGHGQVNLTGSGSSVTVTGTTYSSPANDVQVTVTENGQTSAPFTVTVRSPFTCVGQYPYTQDASNSTFGYISTIYYSVEDQFGSQMPSGLTMNENWTSGVTEDYPHANWVQNSPNGFTSTSASFNDQISGDNTNYYPSPTAPQSPLSSVEVVHWGQAWYVGSTTPGSGVEVQTDTLQHYIDHGRHLNVTSPAK